MNKVVAVLGPTATGKTALAISLCRKFNGEIVSFDSRQAYQEMIIGTGKYSGISGSFPVLSSSLRSSEELSDVTIHLYDVVNPSERLNAFDFSNLAREKMAEIWRRGRFPFLVGGTGFYLDVILGRVKLADVEPNLKLRKRLEKLTTEELIQRLRKISPERLESIDQNNRYRLVRAVEIGERNDVLSEKSPSEPLGKARSSRFQFLILGLTAENSYLYELADERADSMVKSGLLEEVKSLSEKYAWEAPGLKTLGYREFLPYFEGKCTLIEAVQKLKYNTHAYIRRQKTYFKKNSDVLWFNICDPQFDQKVVKAVQSFLK